MWVSPTAWRGAEPRVIGCWPDVPWKPWPFHWMSWRGMSLRSWHSWNSWNVNDIGDDYVALCGTMWLWCWWLVWHGMTIWLWWLDVIGIIGIVTNMVVVVLRMIVVYNRKEGLQYIAVSFWDQVVGCYWELLSCCGAFSLWDCFTHFNVQLHMSVIARNNDWGIHLFRLARQHSPSGRSMKNVQSKLKCNHM